jgi:hypothetical protein
VGYGGISAPNLSLEATRLRRDEIASGWETGLITCRGRRAWAAARLSSQPLGGSSCERSMHYPRLEGRH